MILKKSKLLSFLLLCLFSIQMAWATGNTGTITGRMTLANGYIYTVSSDLTISATSSAAGLTVADNATATIYIPSGVTLTVNGNSRYAGIYIPSNSTLIITGGGTLNATSGKPSYGSAGTNGGDAYFSGDYAITGGGGKGGAGGYGAGAAIGGNGGSGGNAKSGPDGACYYTEKKAYYGTKANAGNNGSNGYTMGTVYIMGTVTVNASNASGMNGSAPSQGSWGAEATAKWTNTYYAGGGGPGGNGGPGSYNAYAIGGGGYGGGSGASGASGGLSWHGSGNANYKNCYGYSGGNGAGYNQSRSSGTGYGNVTKGESYDIRWGGATAYGGYAGSNGGNGTVYKLTATNNSPTVTGASSTTNTTAYPDQVKATLSFNANKGTNAAANRTVYYGVNMDNVTIPTRDGYEFQGYFTSATGGTKVFNSDGTPVSLSTFAANTTLYAHWVGTHHDLYWDYTYDNGGNYINISETDNNNRIKHARLTFYNANGTAVKTVELTAQNVSNKTTGLTADFATHSTAHASITLTTSGTQQLEGENVTIVCSKTEMDSFSSYIFEPLTSNNTKATNWIATTNKNDHKTILSFIGASGDNIYQQPWTVNLIGLKINPQYIFVKPLYKNSNDEWEEITQVASSTGVQCAKVSETAYNGNEDIRVATYTGTYPVWKHDSNNTDYEYAIGLVGFILNGKTYYMNTSTPGAWEPHFTSHDVDSDTKYTATTNTNIVYNVSAATIPVIRFLPYEGYENENAEEHDASKGELLLTTPEILVTGYNDVITDFATTYQAARYGYRFTGWYEIINDQHVDVPTEGNNLTLHRAYTVYPKWEVITSTLQLWDNATVTATYGEALPNITAPVRTGYTFHGYFTEPDGEGEQYYKADGTSEITKWEGLADVTLYAYWTVNTYTITLHTGILVEEEGSQHEFTPTVTATYEEKLPNTFIPDRDGYEFLGYFTEENGAGTMVYDHNGHTNLVWNEANDMNLYANWKQMPTLNLTGNQDPDNLGDFYTTFYYSSKDYRVPGGVEIYTACFDDINDEQTEIVIKKAHGNIIPQGEGVILKSPTKDFTLTESSYTTTFTNNDLTGTDEEKLPDGDCLILSYGERYLGFYRAPSNRNLLAHKAYLENTTGARALTFVFNDRDDNTTAIENVSTENHHIDSTVIYRLDGTRVNKMQKGINIVGGKKIIMK